MEPNVLVGLNCSLSPSPFSIASVLYAQRRAKEQGISCTVRMSQQTISGYLMSNTFANEMAKNDTFTHLLLSCDDIWFPEDTIIKLVNDDKDIVSGVYRRRGDDNAICAFLFPGDSLAKHINEKDLAHVVYAPGHSMLVKREVIQKVYEAYPETEYKDQDGEVIRGIFMPFMHRGMLYLDDYAFCARATACGFKCWIDFSVRLKHRWYVWLDVPDHADDAQCVPENQ